VFCSVIDDFGHSPIPAALNLTIRLLLRPPYKPGKSVRLMLESWGGQSG
jgi:hypothetical protein